MFRDEWAAVVGEDDALDWERSLLNIGSNTTTLVPEDAET